jgi:hypothetical protein
VGGGGGIERQKRTSAEFTKPIVRNWSCQVFAHFFTEELYANNCFFFLLSILQANIHFSSWILKQKKDWLRPIQEMCKKVLFVKDRECFMGRFYKHIFQKLSNGCLFKKIKRQNFLSSER